MGILLSLSCILTLIGLFKLTAETPSNFLTILFLLSNFAVALELFLRTRGSDETKKSHWAHRTSWLIGTILFIISLLKTKDFLAEKESPWPTVILMLATMTMLICLVLIGCKYLLDNLARKNNSPTYKDYAKWTEDSGIFKLTKIIVPVIGACAILLNILIPLLSDSLGPQIQLFDEVVNKIPTIRNYSSSNREKVDEALKELGLDGDSSSTVVDEKFIERYLESHSTEELFNNLYVVNEYIFGGDSSIDEENVFGKMYAIVTTAAEVSNLKTQNINLSHKGAEGFYSEHAEEYPQSSSWEVEGKFYNSSGENVNYQTRTCYSNLTYYGDFAISHASGYSYYKGRYEWVGGVFYDELPSWKPYENFDLHYKGKSILYGDYTSESMLVNSALSVKYFLVGHKTYFLYNDANQHLGDVWIEFVE